MPLFQYVGFYDRSIGGRGVRQGDRLELPEAPMDGMWIAVEDGDQNTPVTPPETNAEPVSDSGPVTTPESAPAAPEAASGPAS